MKYQNYIEYILFESPSETEIEIFKNEMVINHLLQEEYDFYMTIMEDIDKAETSIITEIKSLSDFEFDPVIEKLIADHGKIEKTKKDDHQINDGTSFSFHVANKRGWFKAAAVLMVFIAIPAWLLMHDLNGNTDVIQFNELDCPGYYPTISRGINEALPAYLKAVDYFNKSRPDSALIILDKPGMRLKAEEYDPLLIPVCLIEAGRPEEAVKLLSGIDNDNLCYSQALWFMAISNIMLDNKEQAEVLLLKLKVADPAFNKVADDLIKELKSRKDIILKF